MNNTVKKITFIFENLEHAVFFQTDIGYFYMRELREEICRVASNAIQKVNIVGVVAVEINGNAEGELLLPNGENENASALSRLMEFDDFTATEVCYEDGSLELYYVDYHGDNEGSIPWNNTNQYSCSLNNGNYAIVIGKDKNFADFFRGDGVGIE